MRYFLLAIALLAVANTAAANDARLFWQIVQSSGEVTASGSGLVSVALNPKAPLPDGSVVATGANGRAVLKRGAEQITLGPDSRIVLDCGEMFTRIRQDSGSVLFSIGKRTVPHFEVDAPLLAAIVKGTVFTVSVSDNSSSVSVAEGAVEVATDGRNAVTLVKPGSTARVRADATRQIELSGGGRPPRTVAGFDAGWDPQAGAGSATATDTPALRRSEAAPGVAVQAQLGNEPRAQAKTTIRVAKGAISSPPALAGTLAVDSDATFSTAAWVVTPELAPSSDTSLPSNASHSLRLQNTAGPALRGDVTIYGTNSVFKDVKAAASRATSEVVAKARTAANNSMRKTQSELPISGIALGLGALIAYMIASHIFGIRRRLKDAKPK